MNNKYVGWLLTIMFILIGLGIYMLYNQNLAGFIPLLLGGLMNLGFKTLNPSPHEVGIITFFGVKKPVVVDGLTLVLNWPFDIVGVVIVVVQEKNIDFKGDKGISVVCSDNVPLTGNLSITIGPDYSDDPIGTVNWRSGGEKLIRFDNTGGWAGVEAQLREIMEGYLTTIASTRKYTEMMSSEGTIVGDLKKKLSGDEVIEGSAFVGTTATMGIKVINMQCKFIASKRLMAAGESGAIEDREKDRDETDTRTFTQQVNMVLEQCYQENERRKAVGLAPNPVPPIQDVWEIVDKMRTLNAERRQVIQSPGGGVLNINDISEGDKGKPKK